MKLFAAAKKHILSRGRIGCIGDVATINLARGCAGKCAFCYARCYGGAPPADTLLIYSELAQQLKEELENPRRKALPSFIVFSSASDPFLGGDAIDTLAFQCLQLLLTRGIGVSISTRGRLSNEVLSLFQRYHHLVRIAIPIVSMSDEYHQQWEPGTATPQERLFQIQRLQAVGVNPFLRFEPFIPFVNDETDHIRELVSAAVGLGYDQAIASFFHIRPGVVEQMRREAPESAQRLVLSCFPALQGDRQTVEFDHISPTHVQAMLRRIQRIGRLQGLRISACRCHNPGLPAAICPLVPEETKSAEQRQLFN